MNVVKVVVVLLVMSAVGWAIDACSLTFNQDYYVLAFIGIIISLLLLALRYMLGTLLMSPHLEGSVKVELQQIIITVGMMLFIPLIPLVLCSLNVDKKGIVEGNTIANAKDVLMNRVKSCADIYFKLVDYVHETAAMGSIMVGLHINQISIFFSPFGGYGTVAQLAALPAQSAITAYFLSVGYYMIYVITQSQSFISLIPIGLVLRCFPITRKIGGTLLAVGIGMVFIFPLLVSIGGIIAEPKGPNDLDSPDALTTYSILTTLFFGTTLLGMIPSLIVGGLIIGGMSVILMLESDVGSQVMQMFGPGATSLNDLITGGALTAISNTYDVIATMLLAVFFMPMFEVLLISAIIRSMSATFGAEIDISGVFRAI